MNDALLIPNFLTPDACARLRRAIRAAAGVPAGLLGDGAQRPVRPEVRRSSQVQATTAMARLFETALQAALSRLSSHFAVSLSRWEPPQFLRYGPGDFFVAHQDGNTPLVHDASRHRRVSVILFLSPPSETPRPGAYGDGWLTLHAPWPQAGRQRLSPPPGTLLAFRAETTHEVEPVAHGERLTVVSWCA